MEPISNYRQMSAIWNASPTAQSRPFGEQWEIVAETERQQVRAQRLQDERVARCTAIMMEALNV